MLLQLLTESFPACQNVRSEYRLHAGRLRVAECEAMLHRQEVSQPPRQPQVSPARFGFNDNAERINSRACMVRFCVCVPHNAVERDQVHCPCTLA
jgi:hypothetical protein